MYIFSLYLDTCKFYASFENNLKIKACFYIYLKIKNYI